MCIHGFGGFSKLIILYELSAYTYAGRAARGARTRLRYMRTHGLFDLDVSELALYINKYSVLYRQRGSAAAAAAAIEKDVLR
uniref:Uncharacterized protein n=1 Tax=Trichogramma kaykai TaxID=54128 RepID=A0ABD2VV83_9HYME